MCVCVCVCVCACACAHLCERGRSRNFISPGDIERVLESISMSLYRRERPYRETLKESGGEGTKSWARDINRERGEDFQTLDAMFLAFQASNLLPQMVRE